MKLLLILISVAVTSGESEVPGEDIRTGIMFNQLAISELVKQQRNFEDVRNQISSMSASLMSSQSLLMGFLQKASDRIDSTAGSISTHLEDSRDHMESLAAIVLTMQAQQHNLTDAMKKAVQESSRASQEHTATVENLLIETNARLDALEKSVKYLQISPSNNTSVAFPNEETSTDALHSEGVACPPSFFNIGSECFYILEKKTSWAQARLDCQNLNTNAQPTFNTRDEVEIVFQLPPRRWKRRGMTNVFTDLAEPTDIPALQTKLKEYETTLGGYFWVGGHKVGSRWKWISESPINPGNWIGGYPRKRDRAMSMRMQLPPFASRTGRQRYPAVCELLMRH